MPGQFIGVDVGGTKVLGVVATNAGEVLREERVATPGGGDAILDRVVDVVDALRVDMETPAIGVGMPGLVDHDGVLRFAPNLPGVTELPVRTELERRLPGATVRVENDASCAAWGERILGAARGRDDALLVTLGTGIGGGIISGGRLLTGAHGFAGEIGHMVINPHGPPCRCGQRGCWERYASGSGLGRIAREAANAGQADRVIELAGGDPEDVKGEHVTAAAAEGDEQAGEIFNRFAWWLALGLANLANIYDPSVFVLGGGLVEAGEVLLQPTRTAFVELLEGAEHRPVVEIVPAQLGERAGAIGAAALHWA
jgi:glucokinase